MSSASRIAGAIEALMVDVARALADRRSAIDSDDASSTARFQAFCDLFEEGIVDFTARAFEAVFQLPLRLESAKEAL